MTTVFLFHRDLRWQDNVGFKACMSSKKVLPLFVFNPHQVSPRHNPYYSRNAVQFMVDCIESLNEELGGKLCIMHASSEEEALRTLIKQGVAIRSVVTNRDYTPYARRRDSKLKRWCKAQSIACEFHEDYTLLPMGSVKTSTGGAFQVFTPFYRQCLKRKVPSPTMNDDETLDRSKLVSHHGNAWMPLSRYHEGHVNKSIAARGGRDQALDRLKKAATSTSYDTYRDIPHKQATTLLSPYLKFGCISVREAYHALAKAFGQDSMIVRQLFWREFYANITHAFPRVLRGQVDRTKGNQPQKMKYKHVPWVTDEESLTRWKTGRTGFPIVDAGMRQLNATGFMHNRLRMIVSQFLVKDLHIDWRVGEQYFATQLIDYDPSSNNGGWQWSASTGADAQPYFRIFNPWLQAQRFDPDCKYIKRWIPELRHIPSKVILEWHTQQAPHESGYPPTMVDHKTQSLKAKQLFLGSI